MSERFKLIGGVLNIILNEKNEVLMTLRKNKFDSEKYSLPGGCMEDGETVKQAARREIMEETTLIVAEADLDIVSAMHRITPWNWQSIEYVLVTKKFSGQPQITEPDKCSDFGLHSTHCLIIFQIMQNALLITILIENTFLRLFINGE